MAKSKYQKLMAMPIETEPNAADNEETGSIWETAIMLHRNGLTEMAAKMLTSSPKMTPHAYMTDCVPLEFRDNDILTDLLSRLKGWDDDE